ncbi:hypothetical protein V8D89_012683 [Ganoderma adspersum]
MSRKRAVQTIPSSDSEGESDAPLAGESSSKRPHKATTKAAATAEEEKIKKQLAEFRRLKSQVKSLQKQLNQQQPADNNDPEEPDELHSDQDCLPPESEEENEVELGLSASIQRISTMTSKPTTQPTAVATLATSPVPSHAVPSPAAQASVTRTSESTPAPTDHATSLRPALFRGSVAPASGMRPKVEDYTDDVKDLLLNAVKHFSCYIFTKNTFLSDTQQDTFATDAWKAACNAREEQPLYGLSDRMKRVIWARKSNARGDVSDDVRPHTASAYGFRDGTTVANQRHNIALYQKLVKDGAFHHKTSNAQTGKPEGFAGHPYISQAIRLAFFGNTRTSTGFRFPEAYNLIPTEAVAFVLTMASIFIRAHIEEWSTGHHSALQFSESEFAGTYKALLRDLEDWVKGTEDVWLNIRKKWYRRAFLAGGGIMDGATNGRVSKLVLDSAREELKGRTGLTDSEDEGGSGGEGNSS